MGRKNLSERITTASTPGNDPEVRASLIDQPAVEPTAQLNVRVPQRLKRKLDLIAATEGRTQQDIVSGLLEQLPAPKLPDL